MQMLVYLVPVLALVAIFGALRFMQACRGVESSWQIPLPSNQDDKDKVLQHVARLERSRKRYVLLVISTYLLTMTDQLTVGTANFTPYIWAGYGMVILSLLVIVFRAQFHNDKRSEQTLKQQQQQRAFRKRKDRR